MRKFFVYFLILGVLTLTAQLIPAELPTWTTANYPVNDYLSQAVGGDLNETINLGKKELIQNVFQNAENLFNPRQEQPMHQWVPEREQRLLEQEYATALSNLRDMRTGHSHLVQNFQTAAIQPSASNSGNHRLVNVNRRELMMQYVARERQLRETINGHLIRAAQVESMNQQAAAKEYLKTYPLFEQMKEAVLIQQAVAPPQSQDMAAVYRKLMEPITGTNDGSLPMTLPEVYQRVNQLQDQDMTMNTVKDVASSIAQQLAIQTEQLGNAKGDITLKGFAYRDPQYRNGVPIAQGRVFQTELKRLLEEMGWEVIIPSPATRGLVEKVSLTIEGAVWKNGDASPSGTFQTAIHNRDTGDIVGNSVLHISADLTTNLQPNNLEEISQVEEAVAIHNMQTAPQEVLTGDELKVDVWTNKGLEQSIFQEGDEFVIYCKVNKAAYIRLLYVLADGRYTLLHDSTHIDETKVGQSVPLGEFVVMPPFGSEKLIVLAQNVPHKKVDFIREGLYRFLDTKDGKEAVNLAFAPPERGLAELERDTKGISVSTESKLQ